MARYTCPTCGRTMTERTIYCPQCGTKPVKSTKLPTSRQKIINTIACSSIFILAIFWRFCPYNMDFIAFLCLVTIIVTWSVFTIINKKKSSQDDDIKSNALNDIKNWYDDLPAPPTPYGCKNSNWIFNEAIFINPKNNKFRFPKYKTPKGSLVQIKDVTDYREEYWNHLDPEAKREYSIIEFENDIASGCLEFEVDGFDTFVRRLKKEKFEPYTYFSTKTNREDFIVTIEEIEFFQDQEKENYPQFSDQTINQMLADNLVTEIYIKIEDTEQYLNKLLKNDLKPYCDTHGVLFKQNKANIISDLIEHDVKIAPEKNYILTPKFYGYVNQIFDLYIDALKETVTIFHPIYYPQILEYAKDEVPYTLSKNIQKLIDSKYWMEYQKK